MSSRGNIIITRPDFDVATTYLAAYAKQDLIPYAQNLGYNVIDLYNDHETLPARSEALENALETHNPNFVIFTGHGDERSQRGQENEDLLRMNVNDQLMSGRNVSCIACLTGVQLGPSMVSKTCKSYYGYTADFQFIPYQTENGYPYTTHPLDDPWALAFFDSAFATVHAMLIDKSPKEVFELTLQRYDYWWDHWFHQNDPMADDIMMCLNWDRDAFIAITPNGLYATEKFGLEQALIPILGAGGNRALLPLERIVF